MINKRPAVLTFMLISRFVFFILFQIIIAVFLQSWAESQKYWLLTCTLTNIVSLFLLRSLLIKEKIQYFSIFRFNKKLLKQDMFAILIIIIVSIPLIIFPSYFLSNWLWGNSESYQQIMFQSINVYLIYGLLIIFPITVALTELATYFVYIMPRLKRGIKPNWLAVFLPAIFLSLQHCALPLIIDLKFILFRSLMYLPFALLIGISINKKPSLFPYLAIFHGLIDMLTVIMFLL